MRDTHRLGAQPLTFRRADPITRASPAPARCGEVPLRVLVLEDDPAQCAYLGTILEVLGHEVTACSTGQSAIAAFAATPYSVVVLDWMLDEMDGLAVCSEIRELPGGARAVVVLVTGRDTPADLAEALAAGADDYVTKPVDPDTLRVRLSVAERRLKDRDDRARVETQLVHTAFHDALTSLPNRAMFMDRLDYAHRRYLRSEDAYFGVLYIDLDRFKVINDSLGHLVGDELLIEVARRLRECLRPCDTIARMGGDEFTVLIEQIRDAQDAVMIAERVIDRLTAPFELGDQTVHSGGSVGIALSARGYDKAADLLRDADTALYRAKAAGGGRAVVFDRAMHEEATTVLRLEMGLRRALERGELELQYHPVVDLTTNHVSGLEALLRWRHPERGLLGPSEFVQVAEDSGLAVPLGTWVVDEACRQVRAWEQAGLGRIPVGVNVSPKQFAGQGFIASVERALDQNGLQGKDLWLEITEHAIVHNAAMARRRIDLLRSRGIRLYLDDFGTGFSSLAFLQRHPLDALKIDRTFVNQLGFGPKAVEIIQSMVMLTRALGMQSVVEGIETEAQLDHVRQTGAGLAQGYLFARPLSADGCEALLWDRRLRATG